tara:strand:+ start:343 stop:1311 length:969 start_codon:yes stop_codon:yes gene_type:complete
VKDDTPNRRIPVGISACLTGQQVRHDGGHKHSRYCTEVLARYFRFLPLCPEMGAGLASPRAAMRLVEASDEDQPRLRACRGDQDFSAPMAAFIERVLPTLEGLRGFVLMAKSPSCGMERVRVYSEQGTVSRRDASGLFAGALMARYPLLPVEEEGRLNDDALRENFVERVFVYDDWCRLREQGLSARGLIEFHSRHKFQLLAHCQARYRRLGPMLADLKARPLEDIADDYIAEFMAAMACRADKGDHINAMLHLAGFLRQGLEDADRALIHQQIEAYQRGDVPLVVPMTLLRGAQSKVAQPYLAQQRYMAPYPDALGLRNRL